MPDAKPWWTPVWRGLVMDQGAKHYRQMRNAVWLFLYLLLNADRRTGFLARKLRTIGADMGLSRDTVLRWLNTLRKGGYVATRNTGRCLTIQIQKWRSIVGVGGMPPQKGQVTHPRGWRNLAPPGAGQEQFAPNPHQRTSDRLVSNDITIKKDILNNDMKHQDTPNSGHSAPQGWKPTTREELLAWDLAQALHDQRNLALYLSYARRYPESLLRRALGEAKEVPSAQIRRSRGALFNHLVQRYAQGSDHHPGA